MGEMRNAYRILVGNSEEKYHMEDLDIDRSLILKWICIGVHLTQDMSHCRVIVKIIMTMRLDKNCVFLTSLPIKH
jgi:hypothetical protein